MSAMELTLSVEARRALCAAARETIAARLEGRAASHPAAPPDCDQAAGAFVTLHERGALRGCIGRLRGFGPLRETVKEMALAAAFDPLRAE